jgi:hypothetical protein
MATLRSLANINSLLVNIGFRIFNVEIWGSHSGDNVFWDVKSCKNFRNFGPVASNLKLNIEAKMSSDMSVHFYLASQHHILGDGVFIFKVFYVICIHYKFDTRSFLIVWLLLPIQKLLVNLANWASQHAIYVTLISLTFTDILDLRNKLNGYKTEQVSSRTNLLHFAFPTPMNRVIITSVATDFLVTASVDAPARVCRKITQFQLTREWRRVSLVGVSTQLNLLLCCTKTKYFTILSNTWGSITPRVTRVWI